MMSVERKLLLIIIQISLGNQIWILQYLMLQKEDGVFHEKNTQNIYLSIKSGMEIQQAAHILRLQTTTFINTIHLRKEGHILLLSLVTEISISIHLLPILSVCAALCNNKLWISLCPIMRPIPAGMGRPSLHKRQTIVTRWPANCGHNALPIVTRWSVYRSPDGTSIAISLALIKYF